MYKCKAMLITYRYTVPTVEAFKQLTECVSFFTRKNSVEQLVSDCSEICLPLGPPMASCMQQQQSSHLLTAKGSHLWRGSLTPLTLRSKPAVSAAAMAAAAASVAAMAAAADTTAAASRISTVARGFVGQDTPLAGAYYSMDYDWEQHADATSPLVEAQWAAAPAEVQQAAVLDAAGRPVSALHHFLLSLQHPNQTNNGQVQQQQHVGTPTTSAVTSRVTLPAAAEAAYTTGSAPNHTRASSETLPAHTAAATLDSIPGSPTSPSSSSSSSAVTNEWEQFYRAHPAARFFKERRYLLLEFPCLAPPSQLSHVVEIGAGCGSSLLPVLRAQPACRATASDISSTCLQQLLQAMQHLGLDPQRVDAFTADGTSPELGVRLSGCTADVVLIMFTLSAVLPEGMMGMMCNAAAALRPGGLLCIRDHALYDMVQLRIPADQCIGRHLYRRGDGTLAYFYTTDELAELAVAAGFEVVECEYVCVVNRNRKTGQQLRRTFVHGMFRKPV